MKINGKKIRKWMKDHKGTLCLGCMFVSISGTIFLISRESKKIGKELGWNNFIEMCFKNAHDSDTGAYLSRITNSKTGEMIYQYTVSHENEHFGDFSKLFDMQDTENGFILQNIPMFDQLKHNLSIDEAYAVVRYTDGGVDVVDDIIGLAEAIAKRDGVTVTVK